jgi:hypothetical protein
VVVGRSYENARLFAQLKGWNFRDTVIVSTEYYSALRAIRNTEVWLVGPEWKFQPNDLTDIYDVLQAQGLTYHYGETDWLLN